MLKGIASTVVLGDDNRELDGREVDGLQNLFKTDLAKLRRLFERSKKIQRKVNVPSAPHLQRPRSGSPLLPPLNQLLSTCLTGYLHYIYAALKMPNNEHEA
jgi:hypothetical protein